MTEHKPYLFLRKLIIVSHSNKVVYDQDFHLGVNIIRGRNSSGKSTIANFIFFVLGGDFTNWSTEALKCRDVFAELDINDAIITLKRSVSRHGQQPMSIFWGDLKSGLQDQINWQTFPYRQTENKISYTKAIFDVLSLPDVRTDDDHNITLHQLLRLLYIDQDSPTQSLFRLERFDPPLTRQTVAEVLLGVYDDSLYSNRLQLRNANKSFETKKIEYESISRAYGHVGSEIKINNIYKEIDLTRREIDALNETITSLKDTSKVETRRKSNLKSVKIQEELIGVKNKIRRLKDEINILELDIVDSNQFIDTLKNRIQDLEYSLLTRKAFGELPLTNCPHCLAELGSKADDSACILCHQPKVEDGKKAPAKRLKLEMELQVKESQSLLLEKEKEVAELRGQLVPLISQARTLQKDLDLVIEESQTTRNENIDSLLIDKGKAEKKLEYLNQQVKVVEHLNVLRDNLKALEHEISILKSQILEKEQQQVTKYNIALNTIEKYTLAILRKDLDRQNEFKKGHKVQIDFVRDTYSLDGSNNFSASSKTLFKNSILFSMFFASLELDFFRYPRFILCDNMEDKGMEKERTQNFQNVITQLSSKFDVKHQIIFTTSMISEELENGELCIGDFYDQNNKTLKF